MVDKVNIIAEGDSWFALPLPSNILSQFCPLAMKGSMQYRMIGRQYNRGGQRASGCGDQQSFAANYHTIEQMVIDIKDIKKVVKRCEKANQPIKALLFSAGGNDLINDLIDECEPEKDILDQIRVEAKVDGYPVFLLGGDSGSLLVNLENEAIGLCFAGPMDGGSYGIANHIEDVLTLLGDRGTQYKIA